MIALNIQAKSILTDSVPGTWPIVCQYRLSLRVIDVTGN